MRVQIVASLALLQLQACAAAVLDSSNMFNPNVIQGIANKPHGIKPNSGMGASMGAFEDASSSQGSKKRKGLPRMVSFNGIDLTPAVVTNGLNSMTLDKRATFSGLSSPISDWPSAFQCDALARRGIALPKRCYDLPTVPDPIPADCPDCVIARSATNGGSATTETMALPTDFNLETSLLRDCPIITRRGDFLVRRCPVQETGIEIAKAKKRAPTSSEVWTRSDGGESYLECGSLDARGEFIAKRCPENTVHAAGKTWQTETKKRASGTTERSLFASGLPSLVNECGIMGRSGDLLVRVTCCDTMCNIPDLTNISPIDEDLGASATS